MTDREPERRKVSMTFRAPFVSTTLEREWLQEQTDELVQEFTAAKRDELFARIREGAGNADTLAAQAELQYFLTSMQVISSEQSTQQLAWATWVLAAATIGLFVATVVLIFHD